MAKNKVSHDYLEEKVQLIYSLNERVKHVAILLNDFAKALAPIRFTVNQYDDHLKQELQSKVEKI